MIRKWICILAAILLLPIAGIAEKTSLEEGYFYTWQDLQKAIAESHS